MNYFFPRVCFLKTEFTDNDNRMDFVDKKMEKIENETQSYSTWTFFDFFERITNGIRNSPKKNTPS